MGALALGTGGRVNAFERKLESLELGDEVAFRLLAIFVEIVWLFEPLQRTRRRDSPGPELTRLAHGPA